MGRRRRSGLQDLIEVVALFPWWVGLILSVAAYFWLHGVAVEPLAAATQPGQLGASITRAVFKGFAGVGQYLVPLVCATGAVYSAFRRRQRGQLIKCAAQSGAAHFRDGIGWREFELLVGEAFRLKGFSVVETGGGGADGGVDLAMTKDGEKFLVQCKQWRALKVGVSTVRELYGVMAARGAAGGYIVTSGQFTQEAKDFAAGRNIELIDGSALETMIRDARPRDAEIQASAAVIVPASDTESVPVCPECRSRMVRRTARKGPNAGSAFWGCSRFPACRGTRPAP